MNLFLIRHGRTKGNLEHRYVGKTDESILSEERERLRKKRKILMKLLADRRTVIYVSPMKRCLETMKALFGQNIGDSDVHVEPAFREMDFGTFEYKNYQELDADPKTAAAYQTYIDSGGETAFPGGESKAEFEARVSGAAEVILNEYVAESDQNEDLNLVFLAHGGTIMAIMDRLSEPHRDYFCWNRKPGEGYMAGILHCRDKVKIGDAVPILGTDDICNFSGKDMENSR